MFFCDRSENAFLVGENTLFFYTLMEINKD